MASLDTAFRKLQKSIDAKVDRVQRNSLRELQRELPEWIDRELSVGRSPVENEKFKGYSPSYRRKIRQGAYRKFNKNTRPVNLKLSGEMRRSLSAILIATKKQLRIVFKHKLADIHTNQGAGRSRVKRKLLPQGNEKFNPFLMTKILNKIRANIKRIL